MSRIVATDIPPFDRRFFESKHIVSRIGGGAIGGKATGLARAHHILSEYLPGGVFQGISVGIPRFVVIGTNVFDAFVTRNKLDDVIQDDLADDRLAGMFMRADFPAEFAGDLRGLIGAVRSPLAVRSSSMLEDAMYQPFAGVYGTKMIPNNQPDTDTRYRKLIEAIKFVYASTFFREARGYRRMTQKGSGDEKMAVIMQEVVGLRHQDRFYPDLSGVARSYNFYPVGRAEPEEGVVDLALGLGKTIVDGGRVWTYSPSQPNVPPPFTTADLLRDTQTEFWAVNMGRPPAYDPVRETEYLHRGGLEEAELDGTLARLASTYQCENDRLVMGTGGSGPRVLTFAPLLRLNQPPINDLLRELLTQCSRQLNAAVEIEFAVTLDSAGHTQPRFGFLQVRPMVVSRADVEVTVAEMTGGQVLLASDRTLGNGVIDDVTDIMYIRPDSFTKEQTRAVAADIDRLNKQAVSDGRQYLLIGFGRWGSSDPWLGIPVDWGSISGVRVIVEATLDEMNVELSQGSHFFHNMTSLQLPYFCVAHSGPYRIDWSWLDSQPAHAETTHVRYVRLTSPLMVRVDGRHRRGVITR